ncbi:hypothetical protein BQ8482_380279 [Mesorhizobium delmotii]|uniref:Uncharacterized protein n=1 Tax=Mesorhizobium delmotii TaxID=1631247 RepID=A0A2P9ASE8_9HYPH|nr:hypothetical protein BQ8482_380279 [Mesorhizobium delmotii]
MVKASSDAASHPTSTPSVMTESTESTRPKPRASPGMTRPDGTGRFDVRDIKASISASYHMLSAPAAPAPTAIAPIAITAMTGFIAPGATIRPTKAVKTASAMTRGFRSAKKSLTVASEIWIPVSLRPLSRADISGDHRWGQAIWPAHQPAEEPGYFLAEEPGYFLAEEPGYFLAEEPGHLENCFR